jgi:hypothetical protein
MFGKQNKAKLDSSALAHDVRCMPENRRTVGKSDETDFQNAELPSTT